MREKRENPFRYSDVGKRYHTYDYYLRHRYGGKCVKIPLDAGFTCPNIDGRCGVGGCIYCSASGSGDFTFSGHAIEEQYRLGRERMASKWETARCIPYLQAHTNTYAPIETLRALYERVLALPDTVGLHIATRADCLSAETVSLLAEIAERTDLTVELGLQSIFDETAATINRGHTYADFLEGFARLREASPRIGICVHLINGLPGEDAAMMRESAATVGALGVEQIKLHLLYVLCGTPLEGIYRRGEYRPLEKAEYVEIVVDQLERIPPKTVIGRVTGDAPASELAAPLWSLRKLTVMNEIDKLQRKRDSWQGKALENC